MLKIRRDLFWTLPNMVILILISLILCYLINKVNETYLPIDNISDNYYDITIDKPESSELKDLINNFDSEFASYRIQKYAEKGYTPVYLKNASLNIDIIDGREFNEYDFSNHSNVAIISDALLDGTYESDGKRFFSIDNQSFEVIGLFKKKKNSINRNSDVFVSMLSDSYCNQAGVNGRYYLDNVSEEEVLKMEGSWFRINETVFTISLKKRLSLVKDTTLVSFTVIRSILVFFIFGLLFLFYLWISSNRCLIHICYLCGGDRNKIKKRLFLHWLSISSIGCFLFLLTSIMLLYNIEYIIFLSSFLIIYYVVVLVLINCIIRNTIRKEL